eukprot:1553558-Pleurochrysis_carterae.AAC.1
MVPSSAAAVSASCASVSSAWGPAARGGAEPAGGRRGLLRGSAPRGDARGRQRRQSGHRGARVDHGVRGEAPPRAGGGGGEAHA